MKLGDLDADGDLDVISVGGSSIPNIHIHRNLGGRFVSDPAAIPDTMSTSNTLVELLDADQDGDWDAFIGKSNPSFPAGPHSLLLNDGTGSFALAPAGSVPFVDDDPHDLGMADFNGDGHDDVMGCSLWTSNRVYFGIGGGQFTSLAQFWTGLIADANVLEVADLDNDGDLDVTLAQSAGDTWVHLNDGLAQFQLSQTIASHVVIGLGDMDADGDVDAIAQAGLLRNDGSGSLVSPPSGPLPGLTFPGTDIQIRDLDGDGDLDLLYSEPFRIRRNDGTGVFVSVSVTSSQPRGPIRVDDLDGDGDFDLLFGGSDRMTLFRGNGGVFFREDRGHVQPFRNPSWLTAGDINGDEWPDVYVGAQSINQNLGFGGPDGKFSIAPLTVSPTILIGAVDCAIADLDGDGWNDLYLAQNVRPDEVLINAGSGVFQTVIPVTSSTSAGTRSVGVGDLDSDGDVDALLVQPSSVRQLANDGSADFANVGTGLPGGVFEELELVDLDVDGDLDAVLVGAQNVTWINNGSGSLALGQVLSNNGLFLAIGDIEHDGDPDIFVGRANAADGVLHRRLSTGSYSANAVADGPYRSVSAGFLDVDDDGLLELFLGSSNPTSSNPTSGDVLATFNGVSFTIPAQPLIRSSRSYHVDVADVDQDGDDDVIAIKSPSYPSTSSTLRVYSNLFRQLHWLSPPRIGNAATFAVEGSPLAPWLVGVALRSANIQLAPHGVLRLPPSSLAHYTSGMLDLTGHGEFDIQVPAFSALVGLDVYWQALIGAPVTGFSNLEVTGVGRF